MYLTTNLKKKDIKRNPLVVTYHPLLKSLGKRTTLVVTYHTLLNSLGKVLSKNLNILYMDEEVKKGVLSGTYSFISKCQES